MNYISGLRQFFNKFCCYGCEKDKDENICIFIKVLALHC